MKNDVIRTIQRLAKENGGAPPGERAFVRATGLTSKALNRAGFSTYGEAREAAGFSRGQLTQSYSDDQVFDPLARLTRSKGRFPTQGEVNVAHHADPAAIPSQRAFRRVSQRGSLLEQLRDWCSAHADFADVVALLAAVPVKRRAIAPHGSRVVNGFVYLMRYGAGGKDYKIGFTENVDRRRTQIDMMSPTDVRTVHVIETDDPRGIEKYWQMRFADKQVGTKEVYRLSAEDIAAFKRRRYQ